MRRSLRSLGVAVALAAAACRSGLEGPTAADRAEHGDVAVIVADTGVREAKRPITGAWKGLAYGTGRGLVAIVFCAGYGVAMVAPGAAGSGPFAPVVLAAGAVAGAAVGAVYAPVSMIGGATTAQPEELVAAADGTIREVLDDPHLGDALLASFTEGSRRLVGRTFVEPEQATTLVELRIEAIRLRPGSRGAMDVTVDPSLSVVPETSVRIVHRADGRVVWSGSRALGKPRDDVRELRYVEWGAGEGATLRLEIRRMLAALGADYASVVFVGPPKSDP
jgi:hypothetical protein